jgi:hypothetical protein
MPRLIFIFSSGFFRSDLAGLLIVIMRKKIEELIVFSFLVNELSRCIRRVRQDFSTIEDNFSIMDVFNVIVYLDNYFFTL